MSKELKYKCKVHNKWNWGLENANLTITSPTGGYVRIDKWHMDDRLSKEMRMLVYRIAQQDKEIELTARQMRLLTTYPKAYVYKKPAKRPEWVERLAEAEADAVKRWG